MGRPQLSRGTGNGALKDSRNRSSATACALSNLEIVRLANSALRTAMFLSVLDGGGDGARQPVYHDRGVRRAVASDGLAKDLLFGAEANRLGIGIVDVRIEDEVVMG